MAEAMCKTCHFWHQRLNTNDVRATTGQCRRYPPQLASSADLIRGCHPITYLHEWCGEYKPGAAALAQDQES